MLVVTRKDNNEPIENLVRRFNKKVTQSGVLVAAKRKMYYEKPLSKREQRAIAIRKRARRDQKARDILGIK